MKIGPRLIFACAALSVIAALLAGCATAPRAPAAATAAIPECPLPVVAASGAPYRDPDRAAIATAYPPGGKAALLARLDDSLAQNPDAVPTLAERGYQRAMQGQAIAAERDFTHALRIAPDAEHTHWSYGWALLRLDRPACAVAQWQQAAALHGGRPFWLPYTLAIGYAAAGRTDLAVAWYAQAVASLPSRWGNATALAQSMRFWHASEQRLARMVFAAWQAAGRPAPAATGVRAPL